MQSLKEATNEKHRLAESMPFNQRMINAQLSKEEYLLYLTQLQCIFKAIEVHELPSDHLRRITSIELDIKELTNEGYSAENILTSTQKYASYLASLSGTQVLPHIYLNYLALAYGGQIIKKCVPSSGNLYHFENLKEAISSIRTIQQDEWATEANIGYDYHIAIFEDLENECLILK
ncbi:MAG: biliverdin-producing heme oxygenase [Ferruginibacter sp.]|nr:biliverdin-producing heme oxygenase [Bacteroidota bacterium]MCW5916079.1 biliverdin-producing heme oxygenase [Ferruginibacter sp.]